MEGESKQLMSDLVALETQQASYTVPEPIMTEVMNYITRMQDPDIKKEEYLQLLEWMRLKKEEDPNYELAYLEMIVSQESRNNSRDPQNPIHRINQLRSQLGGLEE